jgi:CCR4-NOT transcription complex subunit 3
MCTIQCKLTCQDEDFDYDTGIYDDLNLMDEEDFTADFAHNDEASLDGASLVDSTEATSTLPKTPAKDEALSKKSTPATKTKKKDSLSVTTGDDHGSAVDDAHAPSSPVLSKKATSRKSTMDSTKVETPTKGGIPPVPPVPAVAATPGMRLLRRQLWPTRRHQLRRLRLRLYRCKRAQSRQRQSCQLPVPSRRRRK